MGISNFIKKTMSFFFQNLSKKLECMEDDNKSGDDAGDDAGDDTGDVADDDAGYGDGERGCLYLCHISCCSIFMRSFEESTASQRKDDITSGNFLPEILERVTKMATKPSLSTSLDSDDLTTNVNDLQEIYWRLWLSWPNK